MGTPSVKAEPGLRDRSHDGLPMADTRPSYKSWKKKYRKMRIVFDHRMQSSEELHKLEQKAKRTAKRLAVENDRLMDLLVDINDSPQIPFERRVDLDMDTDDDEDAEDSDATQKPTKSLKGLLKEVPHRDLSSLKDTDDDFSRELREDLIPSDPEVNPTSFLSPDEIDEYLHELDVRLGLRARPSLAPSVVGTKTMDPSANFALKNPTSVYNWLRRNAPKTFLQDLEKDKDKDKDKDKEKVKEREKDRDREQDQHDGERAGEDKSGSKKRKSGAASRSTKRQSTASRKEKEREKEKEAAESMEWEDDVGYDMPATTNTVIKGKRKRDDDPGYRPKGGSSRPSKKRKSKDGGALSAKAETPTTEKKGSRKSIK